MQIDILTLFPSMFGPFLAGSIVGRAVDRGMVRVRCTDIRDFATDPHRTVDDRPFGGGPGMVMMCEPVFRAVEYIESLDPSRRPMRILLCPQGERLTQARVEQLAAQEWLLILAGHYEGFDERVRIGLETTDISIGDYVLSGGEPAAMVLVDTVVRLLPGAVGDAESVTRESFTTGMLDYPQYTRPRSFRGMDVPEVLLSGHHAKIEAWRREQALERTRRRRPDLLMERPEARRANSPADQDRSA